MPSLPIISGKQCVKALERLGYSVARQRGSHVRLRCSGRTPVTIPMHKELKRGTLGAILRSADISVDDFLALLD